MAESLHILLTKYNEVRYRERVDILAVYKVPKRSFIYTKNGYRALLCVGKKQPPHLVVVPYWVSDEEALSLEYHSICYMCSATDAEIDALMPAVRQFAEGNSIDG